MFRWRRRRNDGVSVSTARTPNRMRIYAVGDVHGRADLLVRLQDLIEQDVARHPGKASQLVYLGDYVDRGPQSREVLELMTSRRPAHLESHFLMGNHEQIMLRFLADPWSSSQWLDCGGRETIASFAPGIPTDRLDDPGEIATGLRAAVPAHQLAFLAGLELSKCFGDYLFVHAGIRPKVSIEKQQAADLLWIREPFLAYAKAHRYVVVHGHNVSEAIEMRPNRIGIDTGAYATGRLSCLVLDDAERLFMDTRQGGPLPLP